MVERWFIKNKKMNYKYMAQKYGISEVMSKLIVNRDIIDDEMIRSYINPEYSMLHDGREMKDIEKAVHILKDKIENGKKIRIVGDYDVDGVISVYILYSALKRCNADVDYEIPDRIKDGYGINVNIIKKAEEEVNDILSHLNERDKQLYKQHYLNGETLEEIAIKNNTKVSNLYNRLSRGRKKIRENIIR